MDAQAVIANLRATEERSGGRREAWRDPWAAERRRLDDLATQASPDVEVERDAFANTWYLLPGDSEEIVLVASHSDCVPNGGWLDGILGVHAGLGVLHAVAQQSRRARTLAVVDWADEEGTRFGRSLLGSAAAAGSLTADELNRLTAEDGTAAPEVVSQYGFDPGALGTPTVRLSAVVAALELHIEQGPRLEREDRSVAAVSGCLGVRRSRIVFTAISEQAQDAGGLATVGRLVPEPMIATAVAARCELTLDLRHRDLEPLGALRAQVDALAASSPCEATVTDLYRQDPVAFDPGLVERAVEICGGEALVSGPLHDSAALAQAGIPVAMLFVPSIAGLSHARGEDTGDEDLAAGIEALHRLVIGLMDPDQTASP
jgi:N-carbamoyl-L-amino-acid hydrolase